MRRTFMDRLNDDFDPTDADRGMKVAARSVRLLHVCERVLFAHNAGLRVGRDDGSELAVRMRDVGEAIGLLEYQATGAQANAFHAELAKEAGIGLSEPNHDPVLGTAAGADAGEPAPRRELGFDELRETNRRRCEQAFHSVEEWKPWDWSNAMVGEVGESCAEGLALLTTIAAKAGACCNITKKMARIWPANQFKQNWNKPEDQRMAELEGKLADELADVVIYADLLATRIGRRLGECVRQKFNEKSVEIASPVMLPAEAPDAPPDAQPAPADLSARPPQEQK